MALGINELIAEGKRDGPATEFSGLTAEQTTGVLANVSTYIAQAPSTLTDIGLGTYGLRLISLQSIGIVKKGISTTGDLESILTDSSVYTGKHMVNSVNDLLGNDRIQRTLIIEVISQSLTTLTREGEITDDTLVNDIAAIASLSSRYTIEQIKSWLDGTTEEELTVEMDALAEGGQYAVELVDTKGADVLEKVIGIGGGSVSTPELALGTIKTADIDAEVDKLIGSKRIATTVNPDEVTTGLPTTPNVGADATSSEISKANSKLNLGDLI